MGTLVLSAFELLALHLELHGLWPGEHALTLPQAHVVAELVAAAPPSLVRLVLSTRANVQHLDQVGLRVAPGSLDDKLVDIGADGLVLHIVGVGHVEGEEDHECFQRASDTDAEPAGRDLDGGPDAPDGGNGGQEVEDNHTTRVRHYVVELRVVLVDGEDPGRMVDGHFVHAGAVTNDARHRGKEQDANHHPDDERVRSEVGVLVGRVAHPDEGSYEDRDA
mmetsp:Transcript_19871/g.24571  ORF Transcript_19871/g.24571 Transcript_19871/m.24571 type:complete len:221 (-) Transcript_19871:3057-3719(-)